MASRKYQHPLKHYAEKWGKSLRTVKRYAAEGRPLDDDALMSELVSPRGRKPSDHPAAAPACPAVEPSQAPASSPATPKPSKYPTNEPAAEDDLENPTAPVKLDASFFQGAGILAAIERLERAERERASAYFQCITRNYPTAYLQNRFKEWMGIVEALRKLALDAPDIRKANDLTIDRSEIETGIGALFASFRTAARSLPTRAAAKLLGARTREEYVEILDAEIEVLLRTLTEISFEAAAAAESEFAQAAQAAGEESEPAAAPAIKAPHSDQDKAPATPKATRKKPKRKAPAQRRAKKEAAE